jgi:gas vesicle protein
VLVDPSMSVNSNKVLGFSSSVLVLIILITTNGNGSIQNAFGSIEDSVDEIVESAEEESDEVRDDAEDLAEEAREDSDEEARDRGDEEDEDESDSDNDGDLSGDPEFPERGLGDNIDDERSNLMSEIEDSVREIKEKIREGTNPSIADFFELQMLMNHLSQIYDTAARGQNPSNQAIADLARGIKG